MQHHLRKKQTVCGRKDMWDTPRRPWYLEVERIDVSSFQSRCHSIVMFCTELCSLSCFMYNKQRFFCWPACKATHKNMYWISEQYFHGQKMLIKELIIYECYTWNVFCQTKYSTLSKPWRYSENRTPWKPLTDTGMPNDYPSLWSVWCFVIAFLWWCSLTNFRNIIRA